MAALSRLSTKHRDAWLTRHARQVPGLCAQVGAVRHVHAWKHQSAEKPAQAGRLPAWRLERELYQIRLRPGVYTNTPHSTPCSGEATAEGMQQSPAGWPHHWCLMAALLVRCLQDEALQGERLQPCSQQACCSRRIIQGSICLSEKQCTSRGAAECMCAAGQACSCSGKALDAIKMVVNGSASMAKNVAKDLNSLSESDSKCRIQCRRWMRQTSKQLLGRTPWTQSR